MGAATRPWDGFDAATIGEALRDIAEGRAARRCGADHLIAAYLHGVFPMARGARGPIEWLEPSLRGVFDLDAFHVPKNLAREVRKGRFEIRFDTAFEAVMRECARPRSVRNGTWMCEPLLEAYLELNARGHCHSVEAWLVERDGRGDATGETLVGGLYGVHIGAAFFGESMFSRPELGGDNASKVCLVHLVERLRQRSFRMLDAQMVNRHLTQFGLIAMPASLFHIRLVHALEVEALWE